MTDPRIAVLSALSSPGWHPVSEAHGMPWDEAEELLAAYDASRTAAVSSAPADQTALRDRIAAALADAEGWQWAPGFDKSQSPTYQHYLRQAAVVLAALPEPADRGAILREAADIADRLMDERYGPDCSYAIGGEDVARELRRMAGEAQQPETQAFVCKCPAVLPATTDRADVLREPVNPCTRGNNFCGQHGYDCPPDEPAAGLPAGGAPHTKEARS